MIKHQFWSVILKLSESIEFPRFNLTGDGQFLHARYANNCQADVQVQVLNQFKGLSSIGGVNSDYLAAGGILRSDVAVV